MPANDGLGARKTWVSIWLHILTALCSALSTLIFPSLSFPGGKQRASLPAHLSENWGKAGFASALAVGEGRYSRKGKGALGIPWSGWSQSSPSARPAAPAGAPPIGAHPAAGHVRELPGRSYAHWRAARSHHLPERKCSAGVGLGHR